MNSLGQYVNNAMYGDKAWNSSMARRINYGAGRSVYISDSGAIVAISTAPLSEPWTLLPSDYGPTMFPSTTATSSKPISPSAADPDADDPASTSASSPSPDKTDRLEARIAAWIMAMQSWKDEMQRKIEASISDNAGQAHEEVSSVIRWWTRLNDKINERIDLLETRINEWEEVDRERSERIIDLERETAHRTESWMGLSRALAALQAEVAEIRSETIDRNQSTRIDLLESVDRVLSRKIEDLSKLAAFQWAVCADTMTREEHDASQEPSPNHDDARQSPRPELESERTGDVGQLGERIQRQRSDIPEIAQARQVLAWVDGLGRANQGDVEWLESAVRDEEDDQEKHAGEEPSEARAAGFAGGGSESADAADADGDGSVRPGASPTAERQEENRWEEVQRLLGEMSRDDQVSVYKDLDHRLWSGS